MLRHLPTPLIAILRRFQFAVQRFVRPEQGAVRLRSGKRWPLVIADSISSATARARKTLDRAALVARRISQLRLSMVATVPDAICFQSYPRTPVISSTASSGCGLSQVPAMAPRRADRHQV